MPALFSPAAPPRERWGGGVAARLSGRPRTVALFVVLAVLTHLPSFLGPLWNPDEGFLAVQARMLADGGVLYDTVVDRKPPLLPWLYQGAFAVFGDDSLWPLRVAAVAAHLVTALLLDSIARRRWGDRCGAAAGAGYLLLSIGLAPEDTQAASFGVFMLPWTVAAFWSADRGRFGRAGLFTAGAALTKQTGGAVALAVVRMAWCAARRDGGRGRPAMARFALGAVLPVVVVALAMNPDRFLFWTVTGSGAYASAAGAWGVALGRALGNSGILLAAAAGLALPAIRLLARRGKFADTDLWVWFGASAVGVVFGFQFYGHYFLQLIPPLVLIGVAALRRLPRWRKAAVVWTCAASAAFLVWGVVAPRPELVHTEQVAAAIRDRTAADESVLVWGMRPDVYWLADRAPASRFLTAGFLTNYSGGRGGVRVGARYAVPGAWSAFREEMAVRPPALIVDDSRGAPYGPALDTVLDGYEPAGVVDGAVFYVRRG